MKRVLPVIVISQFLCTSPWFAGNAVMADLVKNFDLHPGFLAHLTSAVQIGFIAGTLVFALFAIADRFSPSKIFLMSALLCAGFNLLLATEGLSAFALLAIRFLTGFFLAGIYPIGMKIASDHYREGLGKSLGWLVGALVLGTSLPHLLRSITLDLPWKAVIYSTSFLALMGGVGMFLLVPDGPHRKLGASFNSTAFLANFSNKKFSSAAFGYFGHMWELYAFWTFVPFILDNYNSHFPGANLNVPALSFLVIAAGGVACVLSGVFSATLGTWKLATIALCLSCACCILSPLILLNSSVLLLLVYLVFWGMVVVADSPLFSTMVAKSADAQTRGTALTIVNCIGFSITILSIQLLNILFEYLAMPYTFLVLSLGPLLGIAALFRGRVHATSPGE
jgi:MFS family permease